MCAGNGSTLSSTPRALGTQDFTSGSSAGTSRTSILVLEKVASPRDDLAARATYLQGGGSSYHQ